MDQLCKGCGGYNHDVYSIGCDFCARLIVANKFLNDNPNMENTIVRKFHENQKLRLNKRKESKNKPFSQRFQDKADKKGFAYGKVIRKLVDTLEDTLEDNETFESDDEILDIVDESDDQFHDSAQSPGGHE